MELQEYINNSNIQPYREYEIHYGKYAGRYKIYWNPSICEMYEGIRVKRWQTDSTITIGDWVESDDGLCCQLIAVYKARGRILSFYKFPMVTLVGRTKKDGTLIRQRLLCNYTPLGSSTVSGKHRNNVLKDSQKVQYATYLAMGIEINKAYKKVFMSERRRCAAMKLGAIHPEAYKLLEDPTVREELTRQLEPFQEKLKGRLTEEKIINHIEELLEKSQRGSKDHRENIRFVLNLINDKDVRNVPEAEFKELPPPEEI